MNDSTVLLKDFFENKPLYSKLHLLGKRGFTREYVLKEIQGYCSNCQSSKPFHNTSEFNRVGFLLTYEDNSNHVITFRCVTCDENSIRFWITYTQLDAEVIRLEKTGQFPQKELPKSKALSKFFKSDKEEFNKAVVCIANGYGVASFAYMRRIVENNILSLLDLLQDGVEDDSALTQNINELKATSPMSDKIKIANNALPDYLIPDGFNPLGQIYGLLSEGVHSLSDSECLDKAENLIACLEFMISELATHKKNREDFKKRLSLLRK